MEPSCLGLFSTYTIESTREDTHTEKPTISNKKFIFLVVRTDQISTSWDEARLHHADQEAECFELGRSLYYSLKNNTDAYMLMLVSDAATRRHATGTDPKETSWHSNSLVQPS